MKIETKNLQDKAVNIELLRRAVQATVQTADGDLQTLSLVLVDDARISELNQQFLGRAEPTDVMAFAAEEEEESAGEVIISVETAARQAQQQGHSLPRELCILAIHGLLHLLGYDDASQRGQAEMNRLQIQIADAICPPPVSPHSFS